MVRPVTLGPVKGEHASGAQHAPRLAEERRGGGVRERIEQHTVEGSRAQVRNDLLPVAEHRRAGGGVGHTPRVAHGIVKQGTVGLAQNVLRHAVLGEELRADSHAEADFEHAALATRGHLGELLHVRRLVGAHHNLAIAGDEHGLCIFG